MMGHINFRRVVLDDVLSICQCYVATLDGEGLYLDGHSSSLLLVSSITKFGIKLCSMFRRTILCDVPIRRFSSFNGLNIVNVLSCPFNFCTGRYPSQIDSGSTNGSQGSLCHMMGRRFTASLCAYRGHARPIGSMFGG